MDKASLRITAHPHTICHLDGAAHGPMLDMDEGDMNVILHVESANMAIPA